MTQFTFISAGLTDVGLKRSANEDSLLVQNTEHLWLVADGMGGHDNGALASQTTVKGFQSLELPKDMEAAIDAVAGRLHAINARLVDMNQANQLGQMGTTAIALLLREGRFAVVWVGDSRAYVYRRGGLFQLSVDHTHVQDLVDEGMITAEAAIDHPMGHVLTRALGVEEDIQVDVVQDSFEVGDRFVICSDGLTGPVEDRKIREIVENYDPATAVDKLIGAAHEGGAPDNVTVIVVEITDEYL